MGGIAHGASLLQFLFVSNELSSNPSSPPSSLLIPPLAVSIVTFMSGRTNKLRGGVHLMLFSGYGRLFHERTAAASPVPAVLCT